MKIAIRNWIGKYKPETLTIGDTFSGRGTSGMAKDVIVKGTLHEFNYQHDEAILIDENGRHCSVSYGSLHKLKK